MKKGKKPSLNALSERVDLEQATGLQQAITNGNWPRVHEALYNLTDWLMDTIPEASDLENAPRYIDEARGPLHDLWDAVHTIRGERG